ncbi:lipopolysaccharide biosynthesis protein, partial [Curvibacter delicatus]|uniref:lipopolysaccharide biosynthesis protein n=1 Tax=Curvibacter delicatus TaxID=80879 RepID=UPI0034E2CCE4
MTFERFLWWTMVARIRKIRPFWYIDYSKEDARAYLERSFGWEYYGGHHLENRMTAYFHSIYAPQKFKSDFRNNALAALARNGKISRQEAWAEYQKPPHVESDLVQYFKKRLELDDETYDRAMASPPMSWTDYPTYKKRFEMLRPLFYVLAKANLVPMSFYLRELIPFAVPLGVICAAGAFTPALERSMTERLLGAEQLGLYSAGSKVAMLLALIVGSFQTAWGPFSTSIYKEVNAAETYNLVLKLYCFLICFAVMVLDLVSPSLIQLLASYRYSEAAVVVFPLAAAAAVQSVSWITEIGISFSKRSSLSLYSHTIYIGGLR